MLSPVDMVSSSLDAAIQVPVLLWNLSFVTTQPSFCLPLFTM